MSQYGILDHMCDNCEAVEERVFTDTETGTELCLECLGKVAAHVTNSPRSEGDNLGEVLELLGSPWKTLERSE